MIKPTSKASLKQQCLYLSNLNVEKAEKMYDFLVKGMKDIPDVEPATRSFVDNFKQQSGEIFGWLRENEDVLTKGVEFFRGLFSKKGKAPVEALPPINQ